MDLLNFVYDKNAQINDMKYILLFQTISCNDQIMTRLLKLDSV